MTWIMSESPDVAESTLLADIKTKLKSNTLDETTRNLIVHDEELLQRITKLVVSGSEFVNIEMVQFYLNRFKKIALSDDAQNMWDESELKTIREQLNDPNLTKYLTQDGKLQTDGKFGMRTLKFLEIYLNAMDKLGSVKEETEVEPTFEDKTKIIEYNEFQLHGQNVTAKLTVNYKEQSNAAEGTESKREEKDRSFVINFKDREFVVKNNGLDFGEFGDLLETTDDPQNLSEEINKSLNENSFVREFIYMALAVNDTTEGDEDAEGMRGHLSQILGTDEDIGKIQMTRKDKKNNIDQHDRIVFGLNWEGADIGYGDHDPKIELKFDAQGKRIMVFKCLSAVKHDEYGKDTVKYMEALHQQDGVSNGNEDEVKKLLYGETGTPNPDGYKQEFKIDGETPIKDTLLKLRKTHQAWVDLENKLKSHESSSEF